MRAWRAGRPANRLEVNHRQPALGAHRTLSCVHHLENLETLCVACHRATTAARGRGAAGGGGCRSLRFPDLRGSDGEWRRSATGVRRVSG